MESRETSFELLAHFDRAKTVELPDFEWVDEVLPSELSAQPSEGFSLPHLYDDGFIAVPQVTKRGIRWVLQWAAALAVFTFAVSQLIEFTYLLGAEHKLSLAARAGVLEATLPRATYESVTAAIERPLSAYPRLVKQLQLTLTQNGSPMQRQFHARDGDRFFITLSAPYSAIVPGSLRTILFWRSDYRIQAQAERTMPGRKLAFGAGLPTSPKR